MTTLEPAREPTIYFIGVTTGQSSILRVFPAWASALNLGRCRLVGIDLPRHAPVGDYRRVVGFIADDPLSLGALVTTHKIDVFNACRDLFDEVSELAGVMGEVSCLSKRDGRLVASALDPISAGLAIDAFVPAGHFADSGAELFAMGAGGAAIAITWYLMRPEVGTGRPSRVVVSNRSAPRLDSIRRIHRQFGFDVPVEYVLAPEPGENDRVMTGLRPGSLVINATGLGKDVPGSPITDAAPFPVDGLVWDLNYRGELVFLDQARVAARSRHLHIEDGWTYFIHGWTQVIAVVFGIEIPPSAIDRLSEIAGRSRPRGRVA